MSLLSWMRRRFRVLGGVAGAVSYADTGPYRGAPRNPDLRIGDEQAYSTVRYTTTEVACTAAEVVDADCRRCGRPLAESHELQMRGESGARAAVVRVCRQCEPASWLLQSQMSAAARARARGRRNVV